jgi:hypothetical protein
MTRILRPTKSSEEERLPNVHAACGSGSRAVCLAVELAVPVDPSGASHIGTSH